MIEKTNRKSKHKTNNLTITSKAYTSVKEQTVLKGDNEPKDNDEENVDVEQVAKQRQHNNDKQPQQM